MAHDSMERNPYAAPTVKVADVPATLDAELANMVRRFLNFLIDSLILWSVVVAGATFLAALDESFRQSFGTMLLLRLFTAFAYYATFETLLGRTPAKLMTGTRVVTDAGERPTFRAIVLRTLARWVPFEAFSCLSDPPVGWHDRWSGTRVVLTSGAGGNGTFSLRNFADDTSPGGLGLGR
jgi:uncharacterized RDD family membrane protein YckC